MQNKLVGILPPNKIKRGIPRIMGRYSGYSWFTALPTNKDSISNMMIPKYMTNPISGKQTNIHITMFNELHKNYFPNISKAN